MSSPSSDDEEYNDEEYSDEEYSAEEYNDEEYSDEEYEYNYIIREFGSKNPLVRALAVWDLEAVDLLLKQGERILPEATFAAIHNIFFTINVLERLMGAGASPNARLSIASQEPTRRWNQHDVEVDFVAIYPDCSLDGEWYPLTAMSFPHQWDMMSQSHQIEGMRLLLRFGADPYAVYRQNIYQSDIYPFPGQDFDPLHDPPPRGMSMATVFGLRTVAHSLFEDGGQTLPLFDDQVALDLEHRDPQGRTILHSICRSVTGPDARLGSTWNPGMEPVVSPTSEHSTLFHVARLRNGDVLAVDYSGEHILHHMLQADDDRGEPIIKDALGWTLAHCPQLVNQPDRFGTHPLHVALRRLRRRRHPVEDMETVVEQLLEAGADPTSRDSRGNTALHYLAESDLVGSRREATRALFKRFLDLGLDVNTRNVAGSTVPSLLFGWKDIWELRHARRYSTIPCEEACDQVLEWLDQAGANWEEADLFSAIENGNPRHQPIYTPYLIRKGVHPSAPASSEDTTWDGVL